MTVRELIKWLKQFSQDLDVVIALKEPIINTKTNEEVWNALLTEVEYDLDTSEIVLRHKGTYQ